MVSVIADELALGFDDGQGQSVVVAQGEKRGLKRVEGKRLDRAFELLAAALRQAGQIIIRGTFNRPRIVEIHAALRFRTLL